MRGFAHPFLEPKRARIGEGYQPLLADQHLVDAAEAPAVRRVDRHAERGRLPVHRSPGGHDEIREGDQALRVDRLIGNEHRRQLEAVDEVALLVGPRDCDRVQIVAPEEPRASAGRAGSSVGGRARRRAAAGGRRALA